METFELCMLILIWLLIAIIGSLEIYFLIRFMHAAYHSKAYLEQRIARFEYQLSALKSRPSIASSTSEKAPLLNSNNDEEQIRYIERQIRLLGIVLGYNGVLRTVLFFGIWTELLLWGDELQMAQEEVTGAVAVAGDCEKGIKL